MSVRTNNIARWLAIATLFAVVLTVSVPFYCSTGWCCTKHQTEQKQVAQKASCCADKSEHQVKADNADSCCNSQAHSKTPDSNKCDSGCATGCCRLATMPYMLSPVMAIQISAPVSLLIPVPVLNTGIELTDYIPQPPRVLSA